MSRRLHLIYISLFISRSVPARAKGRKLKEGGRGETDKQKERVCFNAKVPGPLLSSKCSDGGEEKAIMRAEHPSKTAALF